MCTADKVNVQGQDVPYVSLGTSFSDYSKDCWTYDGKLVPATPPLSVITVGVVPLQLAVTGGQYCVLPLSVYSTSCQHLLSLLC